MKKKTERELVIQLLFRIYFKSVIEKYISGMRSCVQSHLIIVYSYMYT